MNRAAKLASTYLHRLVGACMAVSVLLASEYHGAIRSNGLPLPGVTVTAVQAGKRIVTTTDEGGVFRFADLPDGVWTIEVEMQGFTRITREVGIAPVAPVPEWELKIATVAELMKGSGPAGAPAVSSLPHARPSQQNGFQRLDVNQSAALTALGHEGAIGNQEVADLSATAASSYTVQGSMSSALGLSQENDWMFGPHGMGMGPMGGPMMGMRGPEGDGAIPGGAVERPHGPGGESPGGMMVRGGPGPMGGGPGGPGGGRVMMGGPGGREGGPGGPGGPGWRDRRSATAFGNARRDPRSMYNGNLFFSLDNSAWDARTYSVTGAQVDKPAYAESRLGFMFGGPLRIPKLVSAEKRIFFMVNYFAQRNRTGVISQPVNMPTGLERTGDFSQTFLQNAPITIYDPATGAPFPGNKIPTSRISAPAAALLVYFPQPNLPFAARNYQTSWSGSNNSDNLNARISNLRIGQKDRLDGGIGYQSRGSTSPNLFGFVDSGSGRGINASIGWSRNITTRLINNVRYTFSRNRELLSPYFANRENVAAGLGIAGTSQNPMNWGPPNLSFTNYANLSDGNASLSRNQTSSIGESLLWVHGSHNYTFGGEYRRQQFNPFADSNGRGTYAFNGSATSLLLNGVAQSGTGYDLADFLLGIPATGSIRYGNPDKYFRGAGYSIYMNDDWRIGTRFTLVAGLRWDYTTPVTELYNRLAGLAVAPGFTAVSPVLPGQNPLPDALIHPDRNNFSPRFGFAFRPCTNHSMVIRGGYGVYYNTSVYNMIAGNMAQQPPFASVLSVSGSTANALSIENGFLLASDRSAAVTYAIDPNYRIGYAQTWTLSVQNDLPFGMFGAVGYLGTKGTRLDQQFIPNSVAPGAAESLLPHGFIYETSNGNSIYHAAQFQLVRRFRSGLAGHASYQFSKSIDNAGTGGRGQGGTPVAQDWLDLSAERALSSFDARHSLNLQLQYSSGMGTAGGTLAKGWRGALMKDWTLAAGISVRSGTPFTALVGGNRSQVGGTAVGNTVRANATGLPVEAAGMLFNTAAFTAPAAGEWGNAGRNTIPGPAVFSLNGSLGRIFRMGERRSIDLQMQAQNLLNHVTINSWGTVLGSNNYGLATGAAGMRTLTAHLRLRF